MKFPMICLFLIGLFRIHAQDSTQWVQGVVKDQRTSQVLTGVAVGFGKSGVVTDDHGHFNIQLARTAGRLSFKMIGYQPVDLVIPPSGNMEVYLEETFYLLNTPVVSASRFERPIEESTISMNVIRSEWPGKLNSNSVSAALDRVSGVQMIDGQANIRGGSGYSYGAGSRVQLLLDDLPALQSDAGFPNWDDLPMENLGQIEIVKGAASAIYGSSAMNGIIHFRTAQPGSEPFTSVSTSVRTFFKPSSDKQWWGKNDEAVLPYEGFVSFVHRRKIGRRDFVASGAIGNRLGFNKDQDYLSGRLHAMTRYRFSDRLNASLGLNLNAGKSSSFFYWKDAGYFEGAAGSANSSRKLRFTIDPSLRYTTRSGYAHKLISRYYYVENAADQNQSNHSDNLTAEYQLSRKFSSIQLHVTGGVLAAKTWTKAELYSDTSFQHQNLAAFLQLEKKWWDRLSVSAGIRYETYRIKGPKRIDGNFIEPEVSQDTFLFRIGLNYRMFKASHLRASIGQGFRFPTIAEKYIRTKAGGLDVVPNPSLFAESGFSYEFGFRQGFKLGGAKGYLDLAAFQSYYYDMMEFLLNNQLQFQSRNIGDTDIKGLETELHVQWPLGSWLLTGGGGYTFIDPRYLEFDLSGKSLPVNERENAPKAQQNAANSSAFSNILKYRSRHLFRYDIQAECGKWQAGFSFNYASHVEAIDWLFELSLFLKGVREYRQERDHGYRIYDFRLGYQLKRLNLQLNLNNAFNEDYTFRPGLMEAPRNLSLRCTYNWN